MFVEIVEQHPKDLPPKLMLFPFAPLVADDYLFHLIE